MAQVVTNQITAVLEVQARDTVLLSVVSRCSVTGKVGLCSVNYELPGRTYLGTIQSAFVVDGSFIQHDRDITLAF